MTKRTILLGSSLLLILTSTALLMAQNPAPAKPNISPSQPVNPESQISSVRLGNYLIDPIRKTVSVFEYFEEDHPNGIHAWGERCKPDTTIHYSTTCLYVGWQQLEFKEYKDRYPAPTIGLFDDKGEPLDMSGYHLIHGEFYEKDGTYYAIVPSSPKQTLKEMKVPRGVAFEQLMPAGDSYYYNSKTLYHVDGTSGSKQLLKVADGSGKPEIKAAHCIYNGTAYYAGFLAVLYGAQKLDAKPADIVEFDLQRDGQREVVLADGRIFVMPYKGVCKDTMSINRWTQLSNARSTISVENNCAYLLSPVKRSGASYTNVYGTLFATPKGFVIADAAFEKFQPIDKVFIFSYDTQTYEEIASDQFQLINKNFYSYKGKLFYNGMPATTPLDINRLRYVSNGYGNPTEWITDGKLLQYIGNQRSEGSSLSFGVAVPVANIDKLMTIDDKLLTDGVNFYLPADYYSMQIQVASIKGLGLNVQIIPPPSNRV